MREWSNRHAWKAWAFGLQGFEPLLLRNSKIPLIVGSLQRQDGFCSVRHMHQTIYLLRHCDYANPRNILPGRLPVPLSPKGINQAERLQTFFADKSISTIYSSAVERCRQTSEIISNQTIPIVYDKRLLETFSAYQGYWGENQHEDGYHFYSHIAELGGETLSDLQNRMSNFWDEKLSHITGNVIICSHGDPLQVLYAHIHDLPLVSDSEVEVNIPGWLEKGEYIELVFKNHHLVETKLPA